MEIWRTEGQAQQRVDQQGRQQVNEQVDRMKAGDVETPEVVIESKGQENDKSVRYEFITCTIDIEIIQTFDNIILDNRTFVIENEGNLERIGINDDARQQD